MESKSKSRTKGNREAIVRGVTICPGIDVGTVRLVDPETTIARDVIEPPRVSAEQQRYRRAVRTLGEQLHQHIEQYHEDSSSEAGAVLKAHEMMLNDEDLHTSVIERIASEHKNAEWAIEEEGKHLIGQFERARDPYFQARAEDVRDLVDHILGILSDKDPSCSPASFGRKQDRVLVSGRLYPSDVVLAERSGALGFATESRALSSHAALLLKGFGIPAVGDLSGLKQVAQDGDIIIVDALDGLVVLRPTPVTIERYLGRKAALEALVAAPSPEPCTTQDGTHVHLLANIENPHQVPLALQNGLEGIGLFRTEFLVLLSDTFPTEEEQYDVYHQVVDVATGKPVTIRTFDIGADKQSPLLHRCTGQNPALGVRGIRRHLLHHPEELRTQMRAILRAAEGGDVRVLLPMVTTVDDVKEAKRHFETVKADLRAEHVPFCEDVRLGAMIEVPAAAIETGAILEQVDFVSVGTNDLLQYLTGADRDNEEVLHYNDAESSALLWLLQFIIDQAKALGRENDVMMCGEMASRPELIPRLLGLGYRSFSIAAVSASALRDAIAGTEVKRTDHE
jgi:phosphoenolpyruvate-protein phosphotransferase (PTS system enzyme I)